MKNNLSIVKEIISMHKNDLIPRINSGGCGIAALAIIRYLEKNYPERSKRVKIAYCYQSMFFSDLGNKIKENRSIITNLKSNNNNNNNNIDDSNNINLEKSVRPWVPAHVMVKLGKYLFDVTTCKVFVDGDELFHYDNIDYIDADFIGKTFLLAIINHCDAHTCWNSAFNKIKGIKKLQKIYNIDLSDVIIWWWGDVMYLTGSGKQIEDSDFNKIIATVKEKLESGWFVAIGCDSQKARKRKHVFVQVIALINSGNGGIFFVKRTREDRKYSLAEKLYKEAAMSIEIAEQLIDNGIDIEKIEIHLDLSENGKSSKFINGIVGMCSAYGFESKIKDEAWASSGIADRYSR